MGGTRNSGYTTQYIRFVLPNVLAFSIERPVDYTRFEQECPEIFGCLSGLRDTIKARPHLHDTMRRKYKTKNAVGYSVDAFLS